MNGYVELANAIIAQASKDYRSAINQLSLNSNDRVALREKNVEEMKKNGRVVLLTASPEVIYERVKDDENRPNLKGRKNIKGIAELMEQRREKYEAAADIVINTDHKTILQICEELVGRLTEMDEK